MIINATLCYLRRDRYTLMLYRNKKPDDIHQGKWNGLGGKFEAGETPEECACREVREESGLIPDELVLKGVLTFPCFDGVNDWVVFVYVIPAFHGDVIPSPEGRLEWIPDHKLLSIELWEGDRIFLPWLEKPGFFSGKFVYKDGSLLHHKVSFYM
ncbi:MAG TPA: 8-oxo-dGTP diphosphatase [bacterium]|nr:8-oxo-dGTP diphosphatase [bacterium]